MQDKPYSLGNVWVNTTKYWNMSAISSTIILLLTLLNSQVAQAQMFSVIHTFANGLDGGNPEGALTIDRAGNLYGTAENGGRHGAGTVFKLAFRGSGWTLTPLFSFAGGNDGAYPLASVTLSATGVLYGTTYGGGGGNCTQYGCGTAFSVTPPGTVCKSVLCQWTETVLYRFSEGASGSNPESPVVLDSMGNLYGTTYYGGSGGAGVVYELMLLNDAWTENVLFSFSGGSGGGNPIAGVIIDTAGNLYGTTEMGGSGDGTVYQLMPSGPPWIERVLYSFMFGSDGGVPFGGVISDGSGNLYGDTTGGGSGGGGTVFELEKSNNWQFSLLYSLPGTYPNGPRSSLTKDAAGNLYGTTYANGTLGYGSIFKLTPSANGWIETTLHNFTGGADGGNPIGGVVLDASGNLYGTTYAGGNQGCYQNAGCGVVWQITPQ